MHTLTVLELLTVWCASGHEVRIGRVPDGAKVRHNVRRVPGQPSPDLRDEELKMMIMKAYADNPSVYGARKI